jgi:TonB family protein
MRCRASRSTIAGLMLAGGFLGAQAPGDGKCPARPPTIPGGRPPTFIVCQVTTPAVWTLGPEKVTYPALLNRARVGGRVDVLFVVDSAGRVDSTSFRVLKSPHDLFTAAAHDAVVRGRGVAGRIGDTPVRQQMRHTFLFVLADSTPLCGVPMADVEPERTVVCGRRTRDLKPGG